MVKNNNKIIEDLDFLDGIPLAVALPEDSTLPDPERLMYYDGLKNRTLYLENEIDREYLIDFSKMIIAFNREDDGKGIPVEKRKPIKILIFSYGGEIDATQHLLDMIAISKTPVYTINFGVAMSGGLYVLLAGHKRFALKNSQALIHEGSGAMEGTAEQVRTHQAQYTKQLKLLSDFVIDRTKISKELYGRKKKTEWFINGTEQVEYGIVDKLIDDISELY